MMNERMIDAHHHLWPGNAIDDQHWRPTDDQVLRRAFEPEDLAPELAIAGVTGTVLMQSVDHTAENERLLDYAARTSFVRGVVAWAPLTQPDAATEHVAQLVDRRAGHRGPRVVGVRCLVGHSVLDWASSAKSLDNFRRLSEAGLSWDIVPVTPQQVAAVIDVAAHVPSLRIIVDHLARPPFDDDGRLAWFDAIDKLAAEPNIAIKLSVGVDALAGSMPWDRAVLRPYISHVLESFGPERCMLASNWPVVLLKVPYSRAWMDTLSVARETIHDAEQLNRITAGTAIEWYGLEEGEATR